MRFMKNHYGQSIIFGKPMCKFPMNIQFFAESGEEGGDNGGGGTEGAGDGADKTPTIDELMAELAKEKAEKAKLKNSFDAASSELANTKRQLRTKMTAEEQEAEAKKAADEAKDARIQELESKFRTMDYSTRYMDIGMDKKTAEMLSELTGELTDVDKFFSALGKFITASNKSAGENAVQELIKSNPEINAGTGGDSKTSLAEERAVALGKRTAGANEDILKYYRR